MSQANLNIAIPPNEVDKDAIQRNHSPIANHTDQDKECIITHATKSPRKSLTKRECNLINLIGDSFKSWYKPWREAFLADGKEFRAVYDLMNHLLHYEDQILSSDIALSDGKLNKIASAVARLIDFGNAILNLDIIIRENDETSSEADPTKLTTIELYHAHIKANKLRQKLLYDYFKNDKRQSGSFCDDGANQSMITLQVPSPTTRTSSPTLHSPSSEKPSRLLIGSNCSINTITESNGDRKISAPSGYHIELVTPAHELSNRQEMTHTTATIRSPAFFNIPSTRLALLRGILAKINDLLSTNPTTEKISNCFELCDTLLHTIERIPIESRSQEVNMIANVLLKSIVRKIFIDDRDNLVEFQNAHWVTLLVSIMKLMTAADFNNYIKQFGSLTDLSTFFQDYLFIIKRLTQPRDKGNSNLLNVEDMNSVGPAYPDCWIEMKLVASSAFLKSLIHIYQCMGQFFPTNQIMWSSFLNCIIDFIVQDILQPSRSMSKQKHELLALDICKTGAEYVWISWNALTFESKQSLLEDIIEPLLRACMILRSQQRSILLPVFYDMMKCNYRGQYMTPGSPVYKTSSISNYFDVDQINTPGLYQDAGNLPQLPTSSSSPINDDYRSFRDVSDDGTVLTRFTHSIINKLNILMNEREYGDELFKSELCAALSGNLNPKYHDKSLPIGASDLNQFNNMAKHTSDLLFEFMQICLDMRQAAILKYAHLHLLCMFKLILFFRDKVDIVPLYLQNLYKLCSLHHTAGRYVEAGYTLLDYAKSLDWSESPTENHCRIINKYFRIQQEQLSDNRSLKIFLYCKIISYFDQGRIWDAAVPLCRELLDIYQHKTYEYAKLAELLARMSSFFASMIDLSQRVSPEYFRVTFYGIGYPPCLRNSTMIYRGKPYEKLGEFQATILSKYPDAKLLTTLSKPDDSVINEPNARYLQINACTPVVDLKSKFGADNLTKIDNAILIYHKYNECDKFEFSRRISKPITAPSKSRVDAASGEFADMWRERTTLTANTLPGMLPFFPVYLEETSTISPIESAIEDLERANDRLSAMVNRFKADKHQEEDIRPLGQLLLGVVDPAVNGGIAKYEKAFFNANSDLQAGNEQQSDPTGHSARPLKSKTAGHDAMENERAPSPEQVDKLKRLIAQQVPILDEAIRLHDARVADIMRPHHEHLEATYKKLKHYILTKYSRYLPANYSRSSMRKYRSMNRSPCGTLRGTISSRISDKRMSDVGFKPSPRSANQPIEPSDAISSNIPYQKLTNERRSLPFLTGINMVGQNSPESQDATLTESSENGGSPLMSCDFDAIFNGNYQKYVPVAAPRKMSSKEETIASGLNGDIYVSVPVYMPQTKNNIYESATRTKELFSSGFQQGDLLSEIEEINNFSLDDQPPSPPAKSPGHTDDLVSI